MLAGGSFGAGSAESVAVPDDAFHSSQGPSIRSFPSPVFADVTAANRLTCWGSFPLSRPFSRAFGQAPVSLQIGVWTHRGDSVGYAYGIHHDTAHLHVHVAICPRTANGNYVGCSTSRSSNSKHKRQMDGIKSWFEQENSRWEKILASPEKLEETLSMRLDADKLVFSPKLNPLQANALQSTQTADAIRLQQLYQAIRNLEAGIAKKRQALAIQSGSGLVSRLMRVPKPRVVQLTEKIATTIERRSIRDMQKKLFQLKRQYRAEHKRYSRLFGFTAYSNRNAHMQHLAQAQSVGV